MTRAFSKSCWGASQAVIMNNAVHDILELIGERFEDVWLRRNTVGMEIIPSWRQ